MSANPQDDARPAAAALPEPQAADSAGGADSAQGQPMPAASARSLHSLELRAVLLLLCMAALIGALVLYLLWARGAFEATQRLYLTTDDSEGVVVGMDMTFSGFAIGRVTAIELARQGTVRIAVDVPVKDAHWLRSSSVFTLEKGVVGAARLRAFTGVLDDPALPAGAERAVLRGDVSAEIPKMVADVRDVLQNVTQLTGAQSALAQTLAELRGFTQKMNSTRGGLMGALTGDEADARRVAELLERSSQLVKRLDAVAARTDGVLQKADQQVLGQDGLVTDARAAVRQVNTLLQDVRQSVAQADAVLKDVQAVTGNAREASTGLGDLRADVEGSLRKIDALIAELNRKWPFAPKAQEVKLP
jgi:phospholipid/cholesterol/gamma-HCH transport system substrate-binding protein